MDDQASSKPIQLIVGLGNPGLRYARTRHNMGYVMLDFLASHYQTNWKQKDEWLCNTTEISSPPHHKVILAKPLTFMNKSGLCVRKIKDCYGLKNSQIIVVCDDVSMPFGFTKVSCRPGTAGHNGMRDIVATVGEGCIRYRIGIGTKPYKEMALEDYVLSAFSEPEVALLKTLSERFVKNVEVLIDKGVLKGLNYIQV